MNADEHDLMGANQTLKGLIVTEVTSNVYYLNDAVWQTVFPHKLKYIHKDKIHICTKLCIH